MKIKDDGGIGIPYSEVAASEVTYGPAKKMVTLETWTPPGWLKELAIRVDELIQDPPVFKIFREEIKSLRAEWEERGQFEAFVPFPVRSVSRGHKIAVFAAVRDRVMQHEADRASNLGYAIRSFVPINPWHVGENEKDDDVRFSAFKDGMYYGGLTWRVIQFSARDKKKLLGWFSEIEAELARKASNPEAIASTAQSQLQAEAQSGTAIPPNSLVGGKNMSPRELADYYGKNLNSVKTRLRSYRISNHEGWREVADASFREARFLYDIGIVGSIIEGIKSRTTNRK